jgi:hypothetical protein
MFDLSKKIVTPIKRKIISKIKNIRVTTANPNKLIILMRKCFFKYLLKERKDTWILLKCKAMNWMAYLVANWQ